jgi:hypothetical protein
MINGLANNIASQITQTDRSTELWKHGACYVTVPMNDGVSPNNRTASMVLQQGNEGFYPLGKGVHDCANRNRVAKYCNITTDAIYYSSSRRPDTLCVTPQNNATAK